MHQEATRVNSTTAPFPHNDAGRYRSPKSKKEALSFHCLVVDDEQRNRQLVTQMIQVLGYRADAAENGDHAFDKMAANGHNLVLTDLDMPHLDGYNLAVKIRKRFNDAKIVIMTGRCQAEVFTMMASGVVDAWLFKPFGMVELSDVLNTLKISSYYHVRKPLGG